MTADGLDLERVRDLVLGESTPGATSPCPPPAEPVPEVLPRALGRYELREVVGRGGFGTVYKAWQADLQRHVALKLLRPGAEEQAGRFLREARTSAGLRHPNVVPVHEVGEVEGALFLVMDLVDGETLGKAALEPTEAARVVACAADAVQYAHEQGVVHRDLKPQNLMRAADGQVWVLDFGLARPLQGDPTLTRSGVIMGTPAYMAPEQAEGLRADERSDVYALGATLYHLLTGQPPFRAASLPMLIARVLHDEPRPPSRLRPGLPRELEVVCLACLEKDPARRYAGAGALAEDLRRVLRHEPILARPPSPAQRLGKWARRNRLLVATAGALVSAFLVLGAAGSAAFALRVGRERDAAIAASQARDRALAEAEAARRHAEEEAAAAEAAVDALIHQVQAQLGDLPGERIRAARGELLRVAGANLARLQALREASLAGGLDEATRARLDARSVDAYAQLGALALEAGLPAEAVASCGSAVAVARRLPGEQRARLGDALRQQAQALHQQGRTEEALAAWEEALGLRRALLAEAGGANTAPVRSDEPARLERRAVAGALLDLGRARLDLGQVEPARACLEEALAEARRLQASGDQEVGPLLLGVTLNDLTRLHRLRGDLDASLAAAEEALALQRRRLEADPEGGTALQNLIAALHDTGKLHARRGDLDAAAACFGEMRAHADELRRRDPGSGLALENLILALGNLAELEGRSGRPEVAGARLEEALPLAEALLARDPTSLRAAGFQADLVHRSGLAREALRDRDGALARQRRAAELYGALLARSPGDSDHAAGRATCLERVGDLLALGGDLRGALAPFQEAVRLRRQVLAARREVEAGSELAEGLCYLGRVQEALGDHAGARAALEEALPLIEAAHALEPARHARQLLLTRKGLADAALAEGRFEDAVTHLGAALELAERAASPGERRQLAEMRGGAELAAGRRPPASSQDQLQLAYLCGRQGRFAAASERFALALQDAALRGDLDRAHLFVGACAAARAASELESGDPAGAAAQRQRALSWLREDLEARRTLIGRRLAGLAPAAKGPRRQLLAGWWGHLQRALEEEPDLASVRGEPDFAALAGEMRAAFPEADGEQ